MSESIFNLSGKVAVITGASKGIGEAIAHILAEYGAKVVVSSRNQESVNKVADEINHKGHEAVGVSCHVGDDAQRKNLIEQAVNIFGGVDILVNNAATNPVYAPIQNADEVLFDKMMNINVKACFLLSNYCYPIMKSRGGGSIINISSVEGLKPSIGLGLYSVNKAALIMLTKTQAREWGRDDIRSNTICPGLIQTKFSTALWSNEATLKKFEKNLALGRMAQPEELTGLALYLASGASSYTTGSTFTVDGGHMIA